ncbi:alpha/beta fold hydrolase [Virgibacillus halodenitrificans]|uniref:alpha/beta fold hydrolase n=1 Tax=Virgibacillus halodenitrificans TaxID=1482 RepID=UPI0013703BCC|nr:alpha/beta hydrolase [Virgibacillus halodenitrificans]
MNSKIITLENKLNVKVNMWEGNHKSSVILLHGLGSTGKSFSELAAILSQNNNVYAFDLPGHGTSTYLDHEDFFSMESLADWVKEVVNYLNVDNFHIVGHSVGGNIGLAFAKKYILKSLILLDGGYIRAKNIPDNTLEDEIKMTEQHIENFTFSSWEAYEKELFNDGMSQMHIDLSKDSMKNENRMIKLIVNPKVARHIVRQKYNEPTDETLMCVSSQVLLLRSTIPQEFNNIREKETKRFNQSINTTVVDVKNASHDIYWDNPLFVAEQINEWIMKL